MRNRKVSIILIITLVIISTFFGCSGVSPYDEQLNLGYKYLQEEKYEEAIIALNKAIEIDEKRPDAYIGLGDVYVARCDEKTVEDTNDALTLGYEKSSSEKIIDAYIRLADELVEKDMADWAIQLLNMAYDDLGNEKLKKRCKELEKEHLPQDQSARMEVVGTIFDNAAVYQSQWDQRMEQNEKTSLRSYGIRLNPPVSAVINGMEVSIDEAATFTTEDGMIGLFPPVGDIDEEIWNNWPYFNKELHLTGYFILENDIDENGLVREPHDDEEIFTYCPNGIYLFRITGCEEYQ